MKLQIYIKLMYQSILRNQMVMAVLILQMAISLMLVTVIISFLNGFNHTVQEQVKREIGTTTIMLTSPVSFSILAKLEKEWRAESKIQKLSYFATTDDQVKFGSHVVVLPVWGVNEDYPYFYGFPVEQLGDGEVMLSINAAKKIFPNRSTEHVVGEMIEINNKLHTVIGVEQVSLVERVYIPHSDFQQAYEKFEGVQVGSLDIDKDSTSLVLEELKPYGPIKWGPVAQSRYQSVIVFILVASLITVLLVLYSIFSFIQLYSFKLIKERDKWDILLLLGATRGNLRSYLYTETASLTIVSLLTATIGYWAIARAVSIEGITFRIDIVVILAIAMIVMTMILLSVELTLRKLRRIVFK